MKHHKFLATTFFSCCALWTIAQAAGSASDAVLEIPKDLQSSCGKSPIATSQTIAKDPEIRAAILSPGAVRTSTDVSISNDLEALTIQAKVIGSDMWSIDTQNANFVKTCAALKSKGDYQSGKSKDLGDMGAQLSQTKENMAKVSKTFQASLEKMQQLFAQGGPAISQNRYSRACFSALTRSAANFKTQSTAFDKAAVKQTNACN